MNTELVLNTIQNRYWPTYNQWRTWGQWVYGLEPHENLKNKIL